MSTLQALPKPGDLVGSKYRIMSTLGSGGMGIVLEAVHIETEAQVAIKYLSPELSATPDAVERFKIEARATGRIRHPNVVAIHDIGEHAGNIYLVMELLRGMSLRTRLARGPLPLAEALRILFPVLRGVSAAHAVKVLHRDLKPENIFLADSPDGLDPVPKVLDFGIAKLSWDAGRTSRTSMHTGLMGTYPFMSFEQLHARADLDARVDVYALGAVLYNMLTGRLPYEADNPVDLALKMLQSEPEPIQAHVPELPAELDAVVQRALARDRDGRFATVDEFAVALEPFSDSLRYRGSGQTGPITARVVADADAGAPRSTPPLATPFAVKDASPSKRPSPAAPVAPRTSLRPWMLGAGAVLVAGVVWLAVRMISGGEVAHVVPRPPEPPEVAKTGGSSVGTPPPPASNSDWDAPEPTGTGTPTGTATPPATITPPATTAPADRPSHALPPTGTGAQPGVQGDAQPRRDQAEPHGDRPPRDKKKKPLRTVEDTDLLLPDWAK